MHRQGCDGRPEQLAVVVEPDDIPGSGGGRPRLTKLPTVRCRCVKDRAKRSLMVATRSELQRWQTDETRVALRELVRTLLRERLALFIGLSAQDWNLQVEILSAFAALHGVGTAVSPVLFAEGRLRQPQRTVLSNMLGDLYEHDRASVENRATIGLFAKPLLGAI